MDIQLKHHEIETAVRNFVAEKIGIDLTGKTLYVKFSMGKGPNALVANLSITEAGAIEIPGYTDRAADPAPVAEVVKLPVAETNTDSEVFQKVGAAAAEALKEDEPAKTVPAEEVPVAAEAAPTTTGLFGQG